MSSNQHVIWKFMLGSGKQVIPMPAHSKLLHVHEQRDEVWLWAEVNPAQETVNRVVGIYGTGLPFDADGTYVGTFHMHRYSFVFHVYDYGVERA